VCHTKLVGIERTFPTIPHMTAFCTVLFWGHHSTPTLPTILVLQKIVSDKIFRTKHLQHYTETSNSETLMVTEIGFFFQNVFRFHPLPKKFGG